MIKVRDITNDEVQDLLNRYNNNHKIDRFDGTLLDDYIIHEVARDTLYKTDTILIRGEYLNCWSSKYVMYYALHSDDIIQEYYY